MMKQIASGDLVMLLPLKIESWVLHRGLCFKELKLRRTVMIKGEGTDTRRIQDKILDMLSTLTHVTLREMIER